MMQITSNPPIRSTYQGRANQKTWTPPPLDTGVTQSSMAANTPPQVQNAWDQAQQQTGFDPSGLGPDGQMTFIPTSFVLRFEQYYNTGSWDLFGSTQASAEAAAQRILDRLDNPLAPVQGADKQAFAAQEKAFYEAFLQNLSAKETPTELTPAEAYTRATGRAVGP